MKKLDSLVKGLFERPALQLEIAGSIDPASDRDALQRTTLEKQLHTRQWLSFGKAERASFKKFPLSLPHWARLTTRPSASLAQAPALETAGELFFEESHALHCH